MSFIFNKSLELGGSQNGGSGEDIKLYTNFEINDGKPIINYINGEVTSFDVGKYLKVTDNLFNPLNNPFEINLKFKLSDVSNYSTIFQSCKGSGADNRFGLTIRVISGYFNLAISLDGSTWGVNFTDTHLLSINTEYWVKCSYDGTNLTLKYSTDGETYTTIYNEAFAGFGYNMPFSCLGNFTGTASYPWNDYLKGTLYLSYCDLTIRDTLVWKPWTIYQ